MVTKIYDTLTPVITPSASALNTSTIYCENLELCEKSEHNSLVLRGSRATFKVVFAPACQTIEQPEDPRLELVAIESKPSSTSVEVCYTVVGGLIKTTSFPGEDDVVRTLVKPVVVGY